MLGVLQEKNPPYIPSVICGRMQRKLLSSNLQRPAFLQTLPVQLDIR